VTAESWSPKGDVNAQPVTLVVNWTADTKR
jgi:hypothetical protein